MGSTPEIEQDLARRLLVEGGTLVFLDVPPGTEFGIDMKSWNTGNKFKGVKMIPPGLHYVYYSAVNSDGDSAPRVGFIHNFKKSEFLVKKWEQEIEDISKSEVGEEEIARLKANLYDLDQFLGPYPFDVWNRWRLLTNRVTESLVARLIPSCGQIRSALDLVSPAPGAIPSKRRRTRPSTAEEREEELLPQLRPSPGTELRLTPLPEKSYPEGSTPAEITRHSLDCSYVLEQMLDHYDRPGDFVGELQFSFACFLVGHSLEAFEAWKRLVGLLCSCDDAIPRHRELYWDMLSVVEAQLQEVPEDFLVDIVANNNYICRCLCELFATMRDNNAVDPRLKSKARRLAETLTAKFGWDFELLLEEDEAPVVVDV